MSSMIQFLTLFAYHWHTTGRLLERAALLSEAEVRESPGYGRGSMYDLFFHLLRADQSWRMALQAGKQSSPARAEDYPTLEALRKGFEQEQCAWQGYLEGLSAEEVEEVVSLTNRRGESLTMPRWRILQHLMLHGMQHHAELAQLLTARGQSPGDIDFIYFE